ncbi:BnaAnng28800D [Brassica napus]|uniref:(rape) hypothetical protein n=1 Tax=Brassica napus TaxID=3708 RepID=A0A078JR76_BRANA|nr:unnamed protein product [Brassica napus]CDY68935.1 BnaAnng28800D [Brassica napus]
MENSLKGLISWQDVYKLYIMNFLDTLESRRDIDFGSAESFQGFLSQLEQTYEHSTVYLRVLEPLQSLKIQKRHFMLNVPPNGFFVHIPDSSAWQEGLIMLKSDFQRKQGRHVFIVGEDCSYSESSTLELPNLCVFEALLTCHLLLRILS